MPKRTAFLLLCIFPCLSWAQSDTALASFKKLFRKRLSMPYLVAYTDKEFVMDSLRNITEDNYIKYRSKVAPKPAAQYIAPHLAKRFLHMSTTMIRKNGDSCHAEFYAIGMVGRKKDIYCFVIERQFISPTFRSSEKFLFTFDKKYKQIDTLCMASEIPGKHGLIDNEYEDLEEEDEYSKFDFKLPWFQETLGVVNRDLSILLEDEIGRSKKYKVNPDGKILKKQLIPVPTP